MHLGTKLDLDCVLEEVPLLVLEVPLLVLEVPLLFMESWSEKLIYRNIESE